MFILLPQKTVNQQQGTGYKPATDTNFLLFYDRKDCSIPDLKTWKLT